MVAPAAAATGFAVVEIEPFGGVDDVGMQRHRHRSNAAVTGVMSLARFAADLLVDVTGIARVILRSEPPCLPEHSIRDKR